MKMFKHSIIKIHKTEKFALMVGSLFISMIITSVGYTLYTMGTGFAYMFDGIAFIIIAIGYPIAVYRTINGYGLFKNRVGKTVKSHVVDIRTWLTIPNDTHKSTTDKNIDKVLTILAVGICKYFDKDINKVDTVIAFLTDLAQNVNDLMPEDKMFAEWLNTTGTYYLMNICNSSFTNNPKMNNELMDIYVAFEEELGFGVGSKEKEALRVTLMRYISELPKMLIKEYELHNNHFGIGFQYFDHH